ncbi:hypothetical protein SAMN05421505_10213 [Sinosporangium album]|uniref:Uncharacterized protein n=1 Tax=Sinosporangium album TaxID=504805 RepID=A0A1G7RRH4_9ACTN|nr:hypothetical protein [Sinosporangium album]SDG13418.1 hypothetical protein SAMN05421505_10213 [Sinosporangium album]
MLVRRVRLVRLELSVRRVPLVRLVLRATLVRLVLRATLELSVRRARPDLPELLGPLVRGARLGLPGRRVRLGLRRSAVGRTPARTGRVTRRHVPRRSRCRSV